VTGLAGRAGPGERVRLTAVYGGLLVVACAGMAVVVYALVRRGVQASIGSAIQRVPTLVIPAAVHPTGATGTVITSSGGRDAGFPKLTVAQATDVASRAALRELGTASWVVLAVFAVLSVGLAWWLAGRVLRPVAAITAAASRLSEGNLDERVALRGPAGQLRQLADTFDAMAARIEQLVGAQQRFAASAAHELRTHLAVQRAAAEIGLANPDPQRVGQIRGKLLDAARDSEALIESLLLLASAEQGLEHREPVRLDAVASAVADELAEEARRRGLALDAVVQPLTVAGDRVLLKHLVHNLLSNAIRYNVPGGRVELRAGPAGLTVRNTGPPVPAGEVEELFEPFRRLHPRRRAPGEGTGLGLSIVAAIARAHQAGVTAGANPDGGLTLQVTFP
jgi:signal transduction histidine kinase